MSVIHAKDIDLAKISYGQPTPRLSYDTFKPVFYDHQPFFMQTPVCEVEIVDRVMYMRNSKLKDAVQDLETKIMGKIDTKSAFIPYISAHVKVYDSHGNPIDFQKRATGRARAIVLLKGIWYSGGRQGCMWYVHQIQMV